MKPEIHFLLSLIRHQIHQTEPDISFTFPSVSEEKLLDMCTFHAVRPLVFAIIKQYPFLFSDTFDTVISDFTQNQRMLQLKIQQSTTLLIQLFETKGIQATSFKGQLIEALLYPPYLPRESGDSDYLFSLQSIPDVLTILAGQGYKPLIYQPSPFRKINTEKTISYMLQSTFQYEISFYKQDEILDIHWRLYPSQIPIQITDNQIIDLKNQPEEFVFWLILIHHGAKDNWVKLKHLMDFGLWMHKFSDTTNWAEKKKQIHDSQLHTSFAIGLYLIQKHLNYAIPDILLTSLDSIQLTEIEAIETAWSEAKSDKKRGGRLRVLRKWMGKQKGVRQKLIHLYQGIAAFSEPNLGEYPRIISFPPTFVFINLTSKAITYLLVKPIESWLNKNKKLYVKNGQPQRT